MDTRSFWVRTGPEIDFETLQADVDTDVVIVGGGITGVTAAQLLAEAGQRVVLLEARKIGAGTTGHSTGNLHVTPDDGFRQIRSKWDREVATAVARSRNEMVDHIESTVARRGLQCGFARRPHFIFALDAEHAAQLEEERNALAEAGLPVTLVDAAPLPASVGVTAALRIDNQAQFHPLAYTRQLARAIAGEGCRVYENSPVLEIVSDDGVVRASGGRVRAQHIIEATHTPKGFNLLQTDLGPYREYGVAARLSDEGQAPVGIIWSLEQNQHSIRSFDVDGARHLITIGEKHKTGQHEDVAGYYAAVEDYVRRYFPVLEITDRWSGQHYRPADGLPYIGKTLNSGRAFVATGFGTSGLLYGPLAAGIMVDEILGRTNPYADVYAAKRFTPVKSAGEFVKENVNVAEQYARDWLSRGGATDVTEMEGLAPGEGRLVEVDGKKVALYRDEQGSAIALSPVCTHLACAVRWNAAERSWDCPCHGSRFTATGDVLEGPALAPLQRL